MLVVNRRFTVRVRPRPDRFRSYKSWQASAACHHLTSQPQIMQAASVPGLREVCRWHVLDIGLPFARPARSWSTELTVSGAVARKYPADVGDHDERLQGLAGPEHEENRPRPHASSAEPNGDEDLTGVEAPVFRGGGGLGRRIPDEEWGPAGEFAGHGQRAPNRHDLCRLSPVNWWSLLAGTVSRWPGPPRRTRPAG